MNVLIAKAIAVALLIAGLIFGFNAFVDHQRDIGYQKRVDRVLGDGHCRTSYEHSMAHLFDALEYRP